MTMKYMFPRKTCISVVLLAAGILALPGPVRAADAEDVPEASMQGRLQQQEQRIRQLEQRILELEKATMAGPPGTPEVEPEREPEPAAAPGSDTDSEPQSTGISALAGDIKETHQPLTGDELVSEEFPGSWPMFGTDMRMKVGGYIKADVVFDFDGTLDPTQFLMSTIPVEGTPEEADDGYVSVFGKETRFNFDVRRVTPGSVPLRGFIEGDFFSSGNQFRLRHAYITAGDFLIGQTWTTLSFLESMPYIIDFAGGDALFGGRAGQIRYQRKLNDSWKISVAAEELTFLGIENPNDFAGRATRQAPLFAVRADYRWDSGLLLLGSSVARLHWDGGATGPSDDATQFAIVAAGRQNLGSDAYLTWNVSWGEGSGENIMAFAGSNANAVLNANGKLETFPAFALVLGAGRNWNSKWSSNISYAYGWLDTPDSRDPLALKRGGVGHVNLIWKPVRQFSAGIEYMWGVTRVQDDRIGRAQRVQMMGKFEF